MPLSSVSIVSLCLIESQEQKSKFLKVSSRTLLISVTLVALFQGYIFDALTFISVRKTFPRHNCSLVISQQDDWGGILGIIQDTPRKWDNLVDCSEVCRFNIESDSVATLISILYYL